MSRPDPPHLTRRGAIAAGLFAGAGLLSGRGAASAEPHARPLRLIEKPIPSTGERLPVVGLGTNDFNPRTPEKLAALRAVLQEIPQLGGKVVDTAAIYGRSESVIGDALASFGIRNRIFLSTKVMARDGAAGKASIERSFKALETPRIDLFQVHNLMDMDEMVPMLQDLKKAGRIRYVGITAVSPAAHERMADAIVKFPLDFIEVEYSLGDRNAASRVLPLAKEHGLAVLIAAPFGGLRSGGASAAFARVRDHALPDWARELGATSWGQLLLQYVVSHPAVTCAIPGTTAVSHLADNLQAARGRLLDAGERAHLEQLWDSMA
ncbi:MAG: aldo/keto reductase [Steroidobacteraceae bacterium]